MFAPCYLLPDAQTSVTISNKRKRSTSAVSPQPLTEVLQQEEIDDIANMPLDVFVRHCPKILECVPPPFKGLEHAWTTVIETPQPEGRPLTPPQSPGLEEFPDSPQPTTSSDTDKIPPCTTHDFFYFVAYRRMPDPIRTEVRHANMPRNETKPLIETTGMVTRSSKRARVETKPEIETDTDKRPFCKIGYNFCRVCNYKVQLAIEID